MKQFKEANWIKTSMHPPQSPDLNPSEFIWNILKQRVKRRHFNNVDQLKQFLCEEWEAISINEIRRRITEMPDRCKKLIETGGQRIKSDRW